MVVVYCDVTQARMGVQGRFLNASGLTRQPKYNLFRGTALRHLVSVCAAKRFQHSNPSFNINMTQHKKHCVLLIDTITQHDTTQKNIVF